MNGITLLTGATGFVGRQILDGLIGKGSKVRLVVRNEMHLELSKKQGVESVIFTPDLFAENAAWWANVCQGVETFIHAAWYTEPSEYIQSAKNIDCLIGTLQIAKGVAFAKVRRFVGVGTCIEYDLSGGWLSVETPLKPTSPYSGAKASAYLALSQYLPNQGVEFVWCRLFYLYGEGEDERRLVPYLRATLAAGVSAKLTNGGQIRDFLDVSQAGSMIVNAAQSGEVGPVNICSGVPISIRQLAEQIADEYGRRDLLDFGARADNLIDPPCVVGVRRK